MAKISDKKDWERMRKVISDTEKKYANAPAQKKTAAERQALIDKALADVNESFKGKKK